MTRWERLGTGLGITLCALSLLLMVLDPQAVLAGWLSAFVFWSGIPIGGLVLLMMIRLIPGSWSEELEKPAEATILLLPMAALASFPILLGVNALYGWATVSAGGEFRGAYLVPWFFVLRTLAMFTVAIVLAMLLLTRRRLSIPVASTGLIVLVLLDTLMATDWIVSLDSDFHSSGFGLYMLCIQMSSALAVLVAIRLATGDRRVKPKLLGALLLTALLFWAYFAFMQFFIIWSGNFPSEVIWYKRHGAGIWAIAEYAIAALDLGPLLLLLLVSPTRRSRRALLGIAAAVLLGKAIESTWLVVPSIDVGIPIALGAAVLALVGIGTLFATGFVWSARNVRLNAQTRRRA